MTKIWISPLHISINVGATKTCFTNLETDYISGTIVTFSPVHAGYSSATPWNFVKGIFDGDFARTCSVGKWNAFYPWILFDLGEVKPIREVRIMTQNFGNSSVLANAVQVKIGNIPPTTDGDFSTFSYFDELPNPVQHSTTYILNGSTLLKGATSPFRNLNSQQF